MEFLILTTFWVILSITVNCNYIALKGTVLRNKVTNNYLNSDISENELACARKCKNNGDCEGIVYNSTEGWCGLVDANGLANTSQGLTGTEFEVESRIEKKCGQWQKVLSVDKSGGILSGSFSNLKAAVLSGGKLRIILDRADNLIFSFAVNSVLIKENVVCGQAEIYVSNTNRWTAYLLCTNGHIHWLRTFMDHTESELFTYYTNYNKTDWFVFEDAYLQVTLRDNSKPYITMNRIHAFSVTAVETIDTFMKVNYHTHTDIFHSDEHVEVTSFFKIGSTFTGNDFDISENSSWITTKYNFSKNIEEFRCTISGNNACQHSESAVNQTLYVDGNWESIFIHTSEGNTVFGSLQSLREEVLNGHRILLYFSDKVRQPDIVILDEESITTVFSLYPLKQSDSNQATVLWEMISTTGKYEKVEFDFMTGNVLNITTGTRECSWHIDKATWTNVFDSESNTTEKLVTAIQSGSSSRIKSKCLNINDSSILFTCFYDVNNLYLDISTSDIKARNNVYPYPTIGDTGLNFSMDANPVWMNLITSTKGNVRRKLWNHRSPSFESVFVVYDHDIIWFVN